MTNLRRSRGYSTEYKIVQEFNYVKNKETGEDVRTNWNATRLGGSSTGLPDIVITNNISNILVSMEVKSTVGDQAYIPIDQIKRCEYIIHKFLIYQTKKVVFAFKFTGGKRVIGHKLPNGKFKTVKRTKSQFYYYVVKYFKDLEGVENLFCFEDGRLEIRGQIVDKNGKTKSFDDFMVIEKRLESVPELKQYLMLYQYQKILEKSTKLLPA